MSAALMTQPHAGMRGVAARRDPLVKSAARVLEILEFFDTIRRPAGAQEVAAALGYPASSTQALLRSLAAQGYLAWDAGCRHYAPTLRVALLGGGWIVPELCGIQPLRALVDSLAQRGGGDVAVMARNRDVAEAIVTSSRRGGSLAGRRDCLSEGASGCCLLAAEDDAAIRRLLHRLNAEAASRHALPANVASFLRNVGVARRRGWIALRDPRDSRLGHIAMRLMARGAPDLVLLLSVPATGLEGRVSALAGTMRDECEPWLRRDPPSPASGTGWAGGPPVPLRSVG